MGQRHSYGIPGRIVNRVLSALFEPPCAACGRVLADPLDGAICDACWTCVRLTPAIHERVHGHPIEAAAAIGDYDGALRDIIHALKYEGRRSIAPRLGALMRSAGADLLAGADVVVPVPLHPRRERARGFNQADDLARALGPPVRLWLRRVRYTTSQIELPKDERHRNVQDAFACCRSPEPGVRSPSVAVLVDDVATTGATLEACAHVLKAGGVKEVRALTAARVGSARR
jgi:ComF family protein